MGFLDKVKNMFIEEIEEDEPVKQEIEKKVEPVEKPVIPVMPEIEEEPLEHVITEKREEKFVFPVYFDDKDFEELERKEEKPKPKPALEPPIREAYGVRKEDKTEKKIFKPTPIISPVYGILDKNYRKEEIKTRKIVSSYEYEYRSNEKVDIDDVRKKAYGTLEDDLEDNLFQKTSILFSDEVEKQEEKNNDTIDIFEEVELQRSKDIDDDYYLDDFEFDDDNMIEEELNKDYTEEEESSYINELNDSDLFNLIDSMYERGENE